MKCENFVLFNDFLYSPLNLGPEKCNCMQIHHSLKLVINAYFCPKTMLGDLKPVIFALNVRNGKNWAEISEI